MKLATTTYDMKQFCRTADEAVKLIAETSFRYLDLGFGNMTPEEELDRIVFRCGELAAKHSMQFVQAHAPDVRLFDGRYDEEAELARFFRQLHACKTLGIPAIVLHALFAPKDSPDYPEGKEEFFCRNQLLYERLFPEMEKTGVKVLVENSALKNTGGKYYFLKGSELREFLDWMNHPLLGAVWDVGHANMENDNQYQSICSLGDRLWAVHIHDNLGIKDLHSAPFMGTTDYDAIVRGLQDIHFPGYFTLEADSFPMNQRSWTYKRRESEGGRLGKVNLEVKLQCEELLYSLGKMILEAYNLFEE